MAKFWKDKIGSDGVKSEDWWRGYYAAPGGVPLPRFEEWIKIVATPCDENGAEVKVVHHHQIGAVLNDCGVPHIRTWVGDWSLVTCPECLKHKPTERQCRSIRDGETLSEYLKATNPQPVSNLQSAIDLLKMDVGRFHTDISNDMLDDAIKQLVLLESIRVKSVEPEPKLDASDNLKTKFFDGVSVDGAKALGVPAQPTDELVEELDDPLIEEELRRIINSEGRVNDFGYDWDGHAARAVLKHLTKKGLLVIPAQQKARNRELVGRIMSELAVDLILDSSVKDMIAKLGLDK